MLKLFSVVYGVAMLGSAIPRDPASLSLGGAGAAMTDNLAYSSLNNASAIVFSDNSMEFAACYQMWQPSSVSGSDNANAGMSFRVSDNFGISAAMAVDMFKPYEITDDNGYSRNSFRPSDLMLAASAGWKFAGNFALGVAGKCLVSNLYDNVTYVSPFFDAMLSYNIPVLFVSAGIKNAGAKLSGAYPLTSYAFVSASSKLCSGRSQIRPLLEFDCFLSGGIRSAAGLEYTYRDFVSARVGYSSGGETPFADYLSFGLGFNVWSLRLNLAYLTGNTSVGGSLCAGIGLKF